MTQTQEIAGGWGWRWRRLRQVRRIEGWAGLWFRLWAALGYRRAGWFVRSTDEPLDPVTAPDGIELRDLTPADEAAYLVFRRGATAADYRARLARQRLGHAAWSEGAIVSVTWVAVREAYMQFLDRRFPLEDDELYLFDSYTLEPYRGQRLQAVIFAWLQERYRGAGYRRMVTLVVPENQPNIRSRQRLGFVRTGTMGYIGLGAWKRHFFRGSRKLAS